VPIVARAERERRRRDPTVRRQRRVLRDVVEWRLRMAAVVRGAALEQRLAELRQDDVRQGGLPLRRAVV
jgi:hypothetical protein